MESEYFWRTRKRDFVLLFKAQRLARSAVCFDHVAQRATQLRRGQLFAAGTSAQRNALAERYEAVVAHTTFQSCMRRPVPAARKVAVHSPDGTVLKVPKPTGRSGEAEIRVYYSDLGIINRVYWFVQTCRNGLLCPFCSRKVLWRHRCEIELGLHAWRGAHPYSYMIFLTYTVPHAASDVLGVLMSRMDLVLAEFRAGKAYQEFRSRHGEAGYIRGTEVTFGETSGWHPHYHEVRLFDSLGILENFKFACRKKFFQFVRFLHSDNDDNDFHALWLKIDRYINANYFLVRVVDGLASDFSIICFLNESESSAEQFSLDFGYMLLYRPYYDGWQRVEVGAFVVRRRHDIEEVLLGVRDEYCRAHTRRRDHQRCEQWLVQIHEMIQNCVTACFENEARSIFLLTRRKENLIKQMRVLKSVDESARGELRGELRGVLADLGQRRAEIQDFLSRRWVDCCVRSGLAREEQRADMLRYSVRASCGVSAAQWGYIAKSAPMELTDAARTKRCRAAGRVAHWEVLRRATDGRLSLAERDKYARLWCDFVAAMRGRAVVYWSPGLRRECGVSPRKSAEGEVLYMFGEGSYDRVAARALPMAISQGVATYQRLPSAFHRLFRGWDLQFSYCGDDPRELELARVRREEHEANVALALRQREERVKKLELEREQRESWRKFVRMCEERDILDAAEARREQLAQAEMFRELAAESEENVEEFAAAVCDEEDE